MATGTVKWFNDDKGFGFITPDESGKDLFVHHSAIQSDGFRTLPEGARVEYDAEAGDKGPRAVNVRRGGRAAAARARRRRAGRASAPLALDDADRPQPRDAPGEARVLNDAHDGVHVLVGERGLLGEAPARRRPHRDAGRLELAPQRAALALLLGGRPAQPAARAVADGAERALHRALAADQHIARGPHGARDEDGLARERAGRALAVHADGPPAVLLELGDVVGDVVDLPRAVRRVGAEHVGDRAAHAVCDRVAVGPGEVRCRRHRGEVRAALVARERRARQLAVRQGDAVTRERAVHRAHVIGAHLVAEPARARVDEHRHLALAQAEARGRVAVDQLLDARDLDEVVARADGPELAGAALAGARGDLRRVGAVEAALGLGRRPVVGRADAAVLDEPARALLEHRVELAAAQRERAALAGAGRHAARDRLDEGAAAAVVELAM